MGLVKVLQKDGDVHVDDDHGREDDKRDQVKGGQDGAAAIAVRQIVVRYVAIRRLNEQRIKDVVPSGARHQPEQEQHAATKRLKVDHFIDGARMNHVTKQGHADDGVNERDEGQQGANIEQGRQGDDQSKKKFADSLCRLLGFGQKRTTTTTT
jgi:hypothetical protein